MAHNFNELLRLMLEKEASDLHVTAYSPIKIRIDEELVAVDNVIQKPEDTKVLIYSIMTKEQIHSFEKNLELDFAYDLAKVARFRINVFRQRACIGAAVRLIPYEIWTFEKCGLPLHVVTDLCNKPKGLVLVTGATGSGKSTTLSAMIDYINNRRPCHILTIEDPIEFVHINKKAIIDQREVYSDTNSFGAALKHVLRQDPDVILIGEMRDLETIASALIIAETGHLVFATLHTSDCAQTINRVVDVFPAYQQGQIRTQLSFVMLGILSQQLIPQVSGKGRALAMEVLMATAAIRSMIREGKIHQIYSVIQTSQKEGMHTMNQSLSELYNNGIISYENCIARSTSPDEFEKLITK